LSNTELISCSKKQSFVALMGSVEDRANARFLSAMLASWYNDEGVLPAYMGLTPESFTEMIGHYFPNVELPAIPLHSVDWKAQMPEYAELVALFNHFAVDDQPERMWIASMLIAGSIGHHHLWEDMGLFSRPDLTALIAENFPELAARNDRDMKWKKFIYKQLCELEGIIACPVPSCDACTDFAICFAPEDQPSI